MKRKIVIFALMFLSLFLSGCTVEYKIKVNKDLSVEESINAYGDNSFFENYPLSSKGTVIDFIMSPHKDYLNENEYEYSNYTNNKFGGSNINGKFSSINNYLTNSKFYKQFYETLNYNVSGSIHEITNNSQFLVYNENDPERFMVENATITLELPYKVISNNADHVDKIRGIYKWDIEKDTVDKDISISFDDSITNINYYNYIDEVIIFIILLIIMIFLFIFTKNKKNNNEL